MALGYRASDVRATADITGRRIGLDARVNGYGGSATAKGFIVTAKAPGEPTVFDLAGSAAHINMATLPANLKAPRVTTNLNPTAYHVKGSVGRTTAVDGTVTLARVDDRRRHDSERHDRRVRADLGRREDRPAVADLRRRAARSGT